MKLLVLGATGGVGVHLLRDAVAAGHEVTVLARRAFDAPPGVRVLVDDVLREGAIDAAVAGQDAVLSALGIRRVSPVNPFSALASPADFTERTARFIVAAMKKHGVRRVIVVSAAGVGDSRPGLNVMMRVMIRYTNVGANYRDLEAMEKVFAASDLDWCCVRPVGLKDGAATGRVRVIDSFPLGAFVSRADVAAWMLAQLGDARVSSRTPIITEARP